MIEELISSCIIIGILKLRNCIITYADNNSKKILGYDEEILTMKINEIIPNYNFTENIHNIIVDSLIIRDKKVSLVNVLINKSTEERVLVFIRQDNGAIRNDILKLFDFFIESLHDDLCITDGKGDVIRVSKSWEEKHSVEAKDVLGENVTKLEEEGIFRPSVTVAVLKERKKIEMVQYNKKGDRILVSGVPIFGDDGEIKWIISYSSWDISNFRILEQRYKELENLAKRYSAEIRELRNRDMKLPGIISESPQMKSILNIIQKVADTDANLLITGETGVGKNLIARTVHQMSNRKDEAFIEINCGTIPENLIESELFGYEKGAFTGAHEDGKVGLIELAQNGTLFLDEISELPLDLQVKLLTVMQNKRIVRVGGTKPIDVDFRLITATNRNLKKLVEEKKFRNDLYFRISVIPINIPPLRERAEDLKELINYLLLKVNKTYNTNKILSSKAKGILMSYHWPGNTRELENVIERLVITSVNDCILSSDIPDDLLLTVKQKGKTNINLREAIEEYEGELIIRAYNKYKTTVGVSEALGISQSTAVRKINKYVRK